MNITEIKTILNYILDNNQLLQAEGKDKITVSISGPCGIGKTALIEEIAKERGARFVKISLSQLEEPGDIVGIPIKQYCMYSPTGEEKWVTEKTVPQFVSMGYTLCPTCEPRMSYAIPDWVPTDPEEDVILLLDDFNRSSQLFMQATMELIHKGEYVSWKLPKNTNIILTENPDDGSYSVSSTDDAQKSRYLSFEMEFDIKPWTFWADQMGLKSELINFAYLNSEIFHRSNRINARSYSLFANACKSLSNISSESSLEMLNMLAKGCFGEDGDYIGGLLVQFIHNNLDKLMSAPEILRGTWKETAPKIKDNVFKNGEYRADIASVLTMRLINYIELLKHPKPEEVDTIIKRIGEIIENDEMLLAEDLIFTLVKKLNNKREFKAKCTKLMMIPKVMAKIA